MALPGIIQAAPDGALGFDCDSIVSFAAAQQFAAQGYKFCVRYVSYRGIQGPHDLSAAEANDILAAGLGLMAVQHVMPEGWAPTADLGQTSGTNAANNAGAVGIPPGVNVWCDLEGVNLDSKPQDVIDYCNAWYYAVAAAGYVPGLYVAYDAILSGRQIYDLAFENYWQSAGDVPMLPQRGYQMSQFLCAPLINGINIDQDSTQTDAEGGQAQWLIAGAD